MYKDYHHWTREAPERKSYSRTTTIFNRRCCLGYAMRCCFQCVKPLPGFLNLQLYCDRFKKPLPPLYQQAIDKLERQQAELDKHVAQQNYDQVSHPSNRSLVLRVESGSFSFLSHSIYCTHPDGLGSMHAQNMELKARAGGRVVQ
jgi:hypothetical protein